MSDNDNKSAIDNITDSDHDSKSEFEKCFTMFIVAVFAFLTYIVLNFESVDRWFVVQIPKRNYRIIAKALILFVVVFLVDSVTSKDRL